MQKMQVWDLLRTTYLFLAKLLQEKFIYLIYFIFGNVFFLGTHWQIWFSTFSNYTTLGKGSPVNSCLWFTSTFSSASSVSSSSCSVSIVSTFVDSLCLVNSYWLSSLFSLSLLVFSFCNDCLSTTSSVTVIWLLFSSSWTESSLEAMSLYQCSLSFMLA